MESSKPRFPGSKMEGSDEAIAISGLSGSGKNTVGRIVAKMLNWGVVEPTFKDLAKSEGISLQEFQKKAMQDFEIDLKFDDELRAQCKEGKVVVTTWLGPWMVQGNPFRVWLDVSLDVRAKRVAGREKQGAGEALTSISRRDSENKERYLKVYGINILEHEGFDLILDANLDSAQELAKKIAEAYKKRKL
ncbi:cytidylate kinase [Candidatus Micrarchaeota archaeon CG10_big_fil_rev_8_21_14_0_10_45_29]|nr:MAG: cytidylate kinase [Candidatus Micrarchaeota archaeon CG10_big_fil_rev_8_21_14_0_10_45_29]